MTHNILGYIESVELPALGVECHAKVDTGAATSSLHADTIEEFDRDGELWVRFHVHFNKHTARIDQACEVKIFDQRMITSSNGHSAKRYILRTQMNIGGLEFETEISLSHRGSMKYPMLIGRAAMTGRFLVDISKNAAGIK